MQEQVSDTAHAFARELWDFHTAPGTHTAGGADVLVALGSHDLRVARHAGRLWSEGTAPVVVFTGDRGRRTGGGAGHARWERTEAEEFADTARAAEHIPDAAVLLETRATNTAENFSFSHEVTAAHGLAVHQAAVTAKPYMARRALAAAAVHWPDVEWSFRGFPGGYANYPDASCSAAELVHFLVGDLQRLDVYARRGWCAPVEIPERVRDAYDRLVALGFTDHLLPDEPPHRSGRWGTHR